MLFDASNHAGIHNIFNETRTSMEVSGIVKAKNSTISDHMDITGSLDGTGLTIGKLKIVGTCILRNTKVNGKTEITGWLKASHTTFNNDVTLRTNQVYAEHSLFQKNLAVLPSSNAKQQILTLKDTTVQGKVTFSSHAGEIILQGNSTIRGKIEGATMIQNKSKS